jgi:hypothetical protein
MRKFLVVTEQGRVKGKFSCRIHEIKENSFDYITDIEIPMGSHKGFDNVAVNKLVEMGVLSNDKITNTGYIDYSKLDYMIITVEGKGLNYVNSIK